MTDLYTLDLRLYADAPQTDFSSFRFCTLAAFPDTPDTRRRLYALVRRGVLDTPGQSGGFEPFEVFEERIFRPCYWAEAGTQVLALDGISWVGLSSLRRTPTPGVSAFGLTVVLPSYRGRGVATMLKRRALAFAAARGDHAVSSEVHEHNLVMRALNERLGFRIRSLS
ncbi:MAG: GNAT family N-acetyltransferase [Deinococcus sp.]